MIYTFHTSRKCEKTCLTLFIEDSTPALYLLVETVVAWCANPCVGREIEYLFHVLNLGNIRSWIPLEGRIIKIVQFCMNEMIKGSLCISRDPLIINGRWSRCARSVWIPIVPEPIVGFAWKTIYHWIVTCLQCSTLPLCIISLLILRTVMMPSRKI